MTRYMYHVWPKIGVKPDYPNAQVGVVAQSEDEAKKLGSRKLKVKPNQVTVLLQCWPDGAPCIVSQTES